ncbi:MAG: ATP-dependent DNA helicase RecG [bacterium]|nr:ATP-dependent DNA helicase RecG [bacterium]
MLSPETPIDKLPRISTYFTSRLKKIGIKTIRDLLFHFPTRYDDFSEIYKIADIIPNQEATIQGIVQTIKSRSAWRRRGMHITEAKIADDSGEIKIIWFNQSYVQNQIAPGKHLSISGKIRQKESGLEMTNPTFELLHDWTTETKHTAKIVAKYPETQGMTSKGIRHFVDIALKQLQKLPDPIPEEIRKKHSFPEINTALKDTHTPENLEDAERAKKRFAFEDLFYLQLWNIEQKQKLAREIAPKIEITPEEIKELLSALPFELTLTQKKSLWEIAQDVGKPHPMNRLLQGDVGSGKTIVVAAIALLMAEKGSQTAFMAPTEILARQHYQTLKKFFPETEVGIALLTSSESRAYYGKNLEQEIKKASLKREIENGNVHIILGTHALIQKDVHFKNLSLVVIDEQHRFGVRQRAELTKSSSLSLSSSSSIPHFLSMSATPIPRTLSLTLWGDLDLSLISELPKNRKSIITKVIDTKKRTEAYDFIRKQIQEGRQAFVICPRIEPSEDTRPELAERHPYVWQNNVWKSNSQTLEVKSVKEEFEKLSKKIFPDLKMAMLHGKLKAKEKESIMKQFSNGTTDILVSTSVIEVGVDVPNATIMFIEGSERFGLAQLYQFRGRVGRGEHQSYCFLFTESSSKSTAERLKSIEEAKNGLELAEYDLKLRGPGEFLGEVQTGMPDLAMKALQHPNLVITAREEAKEILSKDQNLKNYPLLREHLKEFQTHIHWE